MLKPYPLAAENALYNLIVLKCDYKAQHGKILKNDIIQK